MSHVHNNAVKAEECYDYNNRAQADPQNNQQRKRTNAQFVQSNVSTVVLWLAFLFVVCCVVASNITSINADSKRILGGAVAALATYESSTCLVREF